MSEFIGCCLLLGVYSCGVVVVVVVVVVVPVVFVTVVIFVTGEFCRECSVCWWL